MQTLFSTRILVTGIKSSISHCYCITFLYGWANTFLEATLNRYCLQIAGRKQWTMSPYLCNNQTQWISHTINCLTITLTELHYNTSTYMITGHVSWSLWYS